MRKYSKHKIYVALNFAKGLIFKYKNKLSEENLSSESVDKYKDKINKFSLIKSILKKQLPTRRTFESDGYNKNFYCTCGMSTYWYNKYCPDCGQKFESLRVASKRDLSNCIDFMCLELGVREGHIFRINNKDTLYSFSYKGLEVKADDVEYIISNPEDIVELFKDVTSSQIITY